MNGIKRKLSSCWMVALVAWALAGCTVNPPEGQLNCSSDPCNDESAEAVGHEAWAGEIEGKSWIRTTVTIGDDFRTSQFRLRFLFGSNGSKHYPGWLIDDIGIDSL